MMINSYLQDEVSPLSPMSLIADVKKQFTQSTYTHLPVSENGFLIGSVPEDDVRAFDDAKTIMDYKYALDVFFVKKEAYWLDVLETFARNNANIMPVLDENNHYIGYYELIDIIAFFKETPFLSKPGGILIVEKGKKDFSFSEISQIVEGDNGKLLGVFISDERDNVMQFTLKIDSNGLNSIIQSFRRYGYNIILGNEDDTYIKDLKERSEYLKRFLDI
ncbi:CBS domain-containing protein [Flavobacteriaceae bacterium R38]|nr:CBS domain-containing protein [Flavobacteriaceae bacterium R38]